jgi:hypothetical protein
MYKSIISAWAEHKTLLIILGLVMALLPIAATVNGHTIGSNEIKFVDPTEPDNRYMILYPETHQFQIVQIGAENMTGTYTEFPDKYSLNYGVLQEDSLKVENGVMSTKTGNVWIKA